MSVAVAEPDVANVYDDGDDSCASSMLARTLKAMRAERARCAEWVRDARENLEAAELCHSEAVIAERELERLLKGDLFTAEFRDPDALEAEAVHKAMGACRQDYGALDPETEVASAIEANVSTEAPSDVTAAPTEVLTSPNEGPDPPSEGPDPPTEGQTSAAVAPAAPSDTRRPGVPGQMADTIRPHLERLWAEHPGGLTVKVIAAACGLDYHQAYAGVLDLHRAAEVNYANRKDAAGKLVLRPGEALPTPELTKKQAKVLEAVRAIDAGRGTLDFTGFLAEVAERTGFGSASCNGHLSALVSKGWLEAKWGNRERRSVYRLPGAAAPEADAAPDEPEDAEEPTREPSEAERAAEAEAEAKVALTLAEPPRAVPIRAPKHEAEPAGEAPVIPAVFSDEQALRFGPLATLNGGCKWPLGDPAEPGFGYCGHKRDAEVPYCAKHMAAAYAAPPSRTRRPSDHLDRIGRRYS